MKWQFQGRWLATNIEPMLLIGKLLEQKMDYDNKIDSRF